LAIDGQGAFGHLQTRLTVLTLPGPIDPYFLCQLCIQVRLKDLALAAFFASCHLGRDIFRGASFWYNLNQMFYFIYHSPHNRIIIDFLDLINLSQPKGLNVFSLVWRFSNPTPHELYFHPPTLAS
jgi:hypothetical protein